MKLPFPKTPAQLATWRTQPIRFGLHRANTHAGASVPFREPWGYLRYWIQDHYDKVGRADALALAKQAESFYKIAVQAPSETSPLLWYYCFLNLAKAFLLKTPGIYPPDNVEHATHGIAGPANNNSGTGYVKLSKQTVSAYATRTSSTPGRLQVFPALCDALGTPIKISPGTTSTQLSIKHLLSHTVSIHRAFATAYRSPLRFCRVTAIAQEHRKKSGKAGDLWHLLVLDVNDVRASGASIKKFEQPGTLTAVSPTRNTGTHMLEGACARFSNVNFLDKLAEQRTDLKRFVHPLLLPQGYRYYLYPDTMVLRQPCSIYAIMFYLGSIVRYQPQRFSSLVGNKYRWLIEEFLQICPKQFVALMVNEITDSELPFFDK